MINPPSQELVIAVSDFIREISGIRLPETLYPQVFSFIRERAEAAGIGELVYLERLKTHTAEMDVFIQTITIGETFFFRDECQFVFLDQSVFPSLLSTGQHPGFKAWSAACSTGEEAVSLALLALKHSGPDGFSGVEIWASDINRQSLSSLQKGVFKPGSFREEGSRYHPLIHPLILSRGPLSVTLDPACLSCIHTAQVDLSSYDYRDIPDELDLVLLRNVLIYLDEDVRTAIMDALVRKLKIGGYLFLSASEVPLFEHPQLNLVHLDGVYHFRKTVLKKKPVQAQVLKPVSIPVYPRYSPVVTEKIQISAITEHIHDALLGRLQKCFALANSGETEAARRELEIERLCAVDSTHPAVLFMAGYIFLCEGSTSEALSLFDRCISLYPNFWFARYHRAVLSASHNAERSRLDFVCVVRDISKSGHEALSGADFLLEGFDCKYFRDISEKWTVRLSGKGVRNGH